MNLPFLAGRDILQPIRVAVTQQSQASPWRSRLAWLIVGLTILPIVMGLPLWSPYHGWSIEHYNLPYPARVSMLFEALSQLSTLLLAMVGTLIIFAQPENRIGWLLSVVSPLAAATRLCEMYAVYAYVIYPERALPLRELALWMQHWGHIPVTALVSVALPLLFPDGNLPSKRWKWLAAWTIALTGVGSFIVAFHPDVPIGGLFFKIENNLSNPYSIAGLPNFLTLLVDPLLILLLFTMLLACLSLAVRHRHADIITRQQIKWFVFWLVILIALYAVVSFISVLGYSPGLTHFIEIAINVASLSLPIILGISIFKYRLYDIDIIINRTLVYGSLTLAVVGIYVLIVGSLAALFQSSGSLLISLVATGTVAVLFQPIRERLQRSVNRVMFGERDNPVAVLSQIGQRLEATTAPEAVLQGIVETIAQALKLPYAAIEVRADSGFEIAAAYGQSASALVRFPLVFQAATIGQLAIGLRAPGEVFNAADRQLLANVAYQAGAAVHMVCLAADLQRSRERLVSTREEERRRLRRDLHDGLGPALATLSLQAEAARDLLHADVSKSEALMNEVIAGTQAAIANIRQVVYALRPPALDDLGLVSALKEQAAQYSGNGLHITVEAPEQLPALPAAVEVAVYRIVQEALTNVVRHASAHICTVLLTITANVELEICDDGQGIQDVRRAGVGLNSMHERAAELGGQCRIESGAGKGTHITINLPIHTGERNGKH